MRQILIGLMIILMLRFRPEGIFRERPGLDGASGLAARLLRPLRARAAAAPAGSVPGDAPGEAGPAAAAGAGAGSTERTGQGTGDGGPG